MTRVDDIKHDVFVSYAHPDDMAIVGSAGWVTTLVRNIQMLLARRLGKADAYSIWMDRKLDGSAPISHAIMENLERSATLLVVLSPAYLQSEWCRHEANYFLEAIRQSRASGERVFIVEMLPTERANWPSEFKELVSTRLWEHSDSGIPKTLGFPQPTVADNNYYSAIDKLANGIAAVIHKFRQLLSGGDAISHPAKEFPRAEGLNSADQSPLLSIELDRKRETGDYDVFLCHNTEDKAEVKSIGKFLIGQKILPWLDEWDIRPGVSWQTALEGQIGTIKSAAVFVGESGFGPWQNLELEAFLREFASRRCPVIPVVLQSCQHPPQLPTFLRGLQWVDFRLHEPEPLPRLIWGITGKRISIETPLSDA